LDPSPSPLLRPADLLALACVALLLLVAAAALVVRVPGAGLATLWLGISLALIVALRLLGRRQPDRPIGLLAAIAPIGMVPVEWAMNPVVDLLHPQLSDGRLLATDRLLFGETPSLLLQGLLTPALTEALLLGYLSYFTLVLLPMPLLWWKREHQALERYVRILVVLFVTNLACYLAVPAVGPRFTLAARYAAPIHGLFLGDRIHQLFWSVPFFRDCFPSGHTAGALLAAIYSYHRLRGWFWLSLPFTLLCIAATVLCRFHYATDLIAALPLAAWAWTASGLLAPRPAAAPVGPAGARG
jgi:membrane-associated phospholipid phosphatase